jgi:vacuolar-type H+-ATPase subunit E/Vma4
MKRLSIFSVLILSLFCVFPTFAETVPTVTPAEDVYIFTTPTTEVTPVAEEPETKKVAITTPEEDIVQSDEALLADAQTLIREKLIEKYQARLDKVMAQLTEKLAGVPAEVQRKALTEVQGRIAEKRTLVVATKNIDPLKRDITLAILDHITLRLEGMIQQSAQVVQTKAA